MNPESTTHDFLDAYPNLSVRDIEELGVIAQESLSLDSEEFKRNFRRDWKRFPTEAEEARIRAEPTLLLSMLCAARNEFMECFKAGPWGGKS